MTIQKWNFDASHSEVSFKVRHMMFSKVTGYFNEWSGDFAFDPENPTSGKVSVSINAASVDTKNDGRDDHLRSGDFFDVENYPELRFESTSFEEAGKGKLKLNGNLTIRGTSKPITLDVEYHGKGIDPWGKERVGFSATAKLDREDYGLGWNQALEAGGVLVGKTVEIEIQVQAVAAEAEQVGAAE